MTKELLLALKEIKNLRAENKKLKSLAFFDCLTGLYSRRYFENKLKKYIAKLNIKRVKRKNDLKIENLCLVFCDINNFKKVNDRFGHKTGDKVLIEVSKVIRKNLREDDVVSRFGGDEFTIILLNISNEIVEKKIGEIEKDFQKSLSKMKIDVNAGLSMGFAYYRKKETYESLVDRADDRMYKIKENKK